MPLLKDMKCQECGGSWDEHNRLEVTGCGKVICQYCEMACKNYRRYMLPNGTHCMAAFEQEFFQYRLISMNIPAPPSDVKEAKGKYEKILSGELFEQLATSAREYRNIVDEDKRAEARVELEAMRQVLYDRVQESDINRHLFEILHNIEEMRKKFVK